MNAGGIRRDLRESAVSIICACTPISRTSTGVRAQKASHEYVLVSFTHNAYHHSLWRRALEGHIGRSPLDSWTTVDTTTTTEVA